MKMKAPLIVLCALLLVVASVMGTLAFLTSTTDVVKNTFSVGDVKITLDEAKVTLDGVQDGDTRVTENNYKLMPGHAYLKDPTIHVDANSEDCWLFVEITNEIAAIEDAKTIETQMGEKGWTLVTGTENIYWHAVASKGDNIVVFDSFKIKDDVANNTLADYAGKTIVVKGYAVQADGFDTAAEAWAATFGAQTAPEVQG